MHPAISSTNPLMQQPNTHRMQRLLHTGNFSMLAGLVLIIVSILASYQFAHLFSLSVQVSAHIGTLVFATVIKLGYITRCVALNQLHKEKSREF